MKTGTAYLLVVVLAIELAVVESFLTGARPWGHPLPVAAALAALANPALGYAGGRVLRRAAGAVLPGLVWLTMITLLSSQRPEGDVVVAATSRGWSLIAIGAVAAVIGGVLGATPRAGNSR
ncbi:MAG: DUF6113 family protein [Mycobacteriales bacterium]